MPSNSQALTPTQTTSYPVSLEKVSIRGEKIDPGPNPTEAQKEQDFLQLARDRFKMCVDAESSRRAEMLTDLKFYCGDQWDGMVRARREGGPNPRPCLTINRTEKFVKHVVNNMRQSRPAIKVAPVGDTDEEDAQIRQGLIRHIEINSQADTAKDTAFEHMAIMGLGAMRVVDDWASPLSMDQELFVRWVPNIFQLYWDPTASMPDWSDIKFAFIVEDLTQAEFKAQNPNAQPVSAANFSSTGDTAEHWLPGAKIRVAEYFWIDYEKRKLVQLSDGRVGLFGEMPIDVDQGGNTPTVVAERDVNLPQVWWSKISGVEVLRKRKWKGRYIPLIPVIGNQVMLDGQKVIVGMVRYAREPQRLYNYMYSTLVETVALAPRSQFIATAEQIEPYRDLYERANTEPQSVLPYVAATTLGEGQGQLIPPPQRISPSVDIASFVQGLQVADQQLKAVFSIYEASLGQRGPQESGIAINARKIESDTGTYDWGDNFIRSLQHLGRVLNDLLPYYYNTPGRIVQIIREDDTRESITLNQDHEKNGQTKKYDLSQGEYSTIISTEASFATKRQEAAQGMLDLAKVYPPLWQLAGDIFVKELDWPGKDAIAKRLEKALPAGVKDPDPDALPIPPEFQSQLAQYRQQIQVLTQALNQATDKREEIRLKEEFATLRTEMTNISNQIVAMLKTKHDEAKFMSDKQFSQVERLQQKLEPAQPESDSAPQSPQTV